MGPVSLKILLLDLLLPLTRLPELAEGAFPPWLLAHCKVPKAYRFPARLSIPGFLSVAHVFTPLGVSTGPVLVLPLLLAFLLIRTPLTF